MPPSLWLSSSLFFKNSAVIKTDGIALDLAFHGKPHKVVVNIYGLPFGFPGSSHSGAAWTMGVNTSVPMKFEYIAF